MCPVWFPERIWSLWVWNWITLDTIISVSHRDIQLAVWQEPLQRPAPFRRPCWGNPAAFSTDATHLSFDHRLPRRGSRRRCGSIANSFPPPPHWKHFSCHQCVSLVSPFCCSLKSTVMKQSALTAGGTRFKEEDSRRCRRALQLCIRASSCYKIQNECRRWRRT